MAETSVQPVWSGNTIINRPPPIRFVQGATLQPGTTLTGEAVTSTPLQEGLTVPYSLVWGNGQAHANANATAAAAPQPKMASMAAMAGAQVAGSGMQMTTSLVQAGLNYDLSRRRLKMEGEQFTASQAQQQRQFDTSINFSKQSLGQQGSQFDASLALSRQQFGLQQQQFGFEKQKFDFVMGQTKAAGLFLPEQFSSGASNYFRGSGATAATGQARRGPSWSPY